MKREVRDELLDMLPHGHPDAEGSRRDITRINRLLGSFRWWPSSLCPIIRPGDRILEIGAGTGCLAAQLARKFHNVSIDALDLTPRPSALPESVKWVRADALSFDGYSNYEVIIGNFLLHQFEDGELQALGARIQSSARVLAFSETARRRLHLYQFSLLGLLPMNHITLHDGRISIQSGFRDDELPRLLQLNSPDWQIHTQSTWLGLYRLLALRASGDAAEKDAAK